MASLLKRIILGLAMLAIPAGPVAARADSLANARAEAKKHYDRAMELNEDGQVAEAVIELKRAYELAPHHAVLYNLGQAYITLAKPVEAVAALQRYLHEGGKAIKPDRRTEVEREIARQKTRIATLDIRVLPDGALVAIDGDDVGKTPLAGPARVGIGKHVVAATAAGYEPGEAKIEVAGEDNKVVELKLAPRAGQPSAPVAVAEPAPTSAPIPAPAPAAAPVPAPAAPRPAAASDVSSTYVPSEQPVPGASLAPAQGEVTESSEPSKGNGLRTTGMITTVVGVVGLVVGGALWVDALDTNRQATTQWQTDQSQAHSTRLDAEGLATGANVCLIAGGVLTGLGVVTTLLSFVDDSPAKSVAVAPALGPNFAGLTMGGAW